MKADRYVELLQGDPREWLLDSGEPAARLIALTSLFDRPLDHPDVEDARRCVLADHSVRRLMESLSPWGVDINLSGHNSPAFAPNQLNLLADMGVGAGDDVRLETLLDAMLEHQGADGRFQSFGKWRNMREPAWGSLLCDTHAITEVLIRFGRGDDPRVRRSLEGMAGDLYETDQGPAWRCIPDRRSGFRGPGRKNDFCPQVTLEALRAFARLPRSRRPSNVLEAADVALGAWRFRGEIKPYMFGHGRQFKTVKWPAVWYDIHHLLDTLGRYPEMWRGGDGEGSNTDQTTPAGQAEESVDARPPLSGSTRHERRRALAELGACLIAYNFGPDGKVTPRSCYRGFEEFSFGQKKAPSPFATARLCAVLRRFDDLVDEIGSVDVLALSSSKGGTGAAVPPR